MVFCDTLNAMIEDQMKIKINLPKMDSNGFSMIRLKLTVVREHLSNCFI